MKFRDNLPSFDTRLKFLLFLGYCTLVFLISTLLIWSVAAPLANSSLTQGIVTVGSERQTIAHVDGGKIDELYVEVGDIVETGQPLLKLDDHLLRSELRALKSQRFARSARMDRLQSERRGTETPVFRDQLLYEAKSDPIVKELIEGETRNFEARRESIRAKNALLDHQIKKSLEKNKKLDLQIKSIGRQITIARQQAKSANDLFINGYGTRARATSLQRDVEELITRRLSIESQIEEIKGIIRNAELSRESNFADYINEIEAASITITEELATIDEKLGSVSEKIKSTTIVSNIDGVIVDLKFNSSRDVILPASPIVEIVPQSSTLLIEASIAPKDIEGIQEGVEVEVRFPAFAVSNVPTVNGVVSLVSPDIIADDREPHYRLHVAVTNWEAIGEELNIIPGMPAEIIIKKRNRTLFEYLTSPLMDHILRTTS